MAETTHQSLDVREFLLAGSRDIDSLVRLRRAQGQSVTQRRRLEGLVIELMENPVVDGKEMDPDEAALAIGAGLWALGRLEEAIASLAGGSSAEADFFLGQCYLEGGFHERAAEAFERARRGKAATRHVATVGHIEATAKAGKIDGALAEARALAKSHEKDPAVHHVLGLCYDLTGRYSEAVSEYEQALALDPGHQAAAFRLGLNYALRGDEERALECYESIAAGPSSYINALINLGVLYEDRREYQKAIECFRRVLRADPNHTRARMYLKDAHASLDMVFDEDRQRELDRRTELLAVPVSDFELSVRVRNCLQRMNIHTLGDLVHHTEEELLASKNFGETSLQEIKEMLVARNLRLGQDREEAAEAAIGAPAAEAPEPTVAATPDESLLQTSIAELDLSLRSRKCMERLGISTIGQLIEHSAEELLASRNFGRTSLSEVSEKLLRYGLALKESPPSEDETEGSPDDEGKVTNDAE